MIYTARSAAAALNCSPRTVRNWARRLGLPHHGAAYLVTEEHLDRLRATVRPHAGRPPRGWAEGVEYLRALAREERT